MSMQRIQKIYCCKRKRKEEEERHHTEHILMHKTKQITAHTHTHTHTCVHTLNVNVNHGHAYNQRIPNKNQKEKYSDGRWMLHINTYLYYQYAYTLLVGNMSNILLNVYDKHKQIYIMDIYLSCTLCLGHGTSKQQFLYKQETYLQFVNCNL